MTIDQIITGLDNENILSQLEKMTPLEREQHFAPMFNVVRPTTKFFETVKDKQKPDVQRAIVKATTQAKIDKLPEGAAKDFLKNLGF